VLTDHCWRACSVITAVEEIGTTLFIKAIKEYVLNGLHVPEEDVNTLFVKENVDALRAQLDYDSNGKVCWVAFPASCVAPLVHVLRFSQLSCAAAVAPHHRKAL
jgi:hypothetical protein